MLNLDYYSITFYLITLIKLVNAPMEEKDCLKVKYLRFDTCKIKAEDSNFHIIITIYAPLNQQEH